MEKILVLLDKHLSNFETDGQQCLLTCHLQYIILSYSIKTDTSSQLFHYT